MNSDQVFHGLHASGCFVMPNPWDAGSARMFERLGFQAVATTSSGFAWTRGQDDGAVGIDGVLDHLRDIVSAVRIPVNADFEGGYATEPDDVAANVTRAVATGVAGISIEDATGNADAPLFDFDLAVDRVRAARAAIDRSGTGVFFTARTEGFIAGRPDLEESIRRLVAFAEAGADCLYAPGITTPDDISAVVRAVAPKPVNVLVGGAFTTVPALARLGVRRISTGGALARAAFSGALDAAREIADMGTFTRLGEAYSFAELNGAGRAR